MRYLNVVKSLIHHKMNVLLSALWGSVVAVVGSAHATLVAYTTGNFTLMGYWTVTAAVVTVAYALIRAINGKNDADAERPLMPRIRALLREKNTGKCSFSD